MHRTVLWVLAAVAGVLLVAGVTAAASSLSTQTIGLSSEPLTAGEQLTPRATATPTATATATPKPKARRKKRTPTPTPTPAATATPTAVPTVDDHGGGGDDHSGHGSGSDDNSGHGGGGGDDD
jgi:hypothetical protein